MSYEEIIGDINSANKNVCLIAVSKKQSAEKIENIILKGHNDFGENQLQEVENKWIALKEKYPNTTLHFVGSIQSRKLERIFQLCDEIHSIDRLKLVVKIKELEKKHKVSKSYYVQVNTGNEPQKSGVLLDEIDNFLHSAKFEYDFFIKGLMCLPPQKEDPKKHFLILKNIAEKHSILNLSMGMSDDFKDAIDCGATHIRLGTAIFGERS